ncbi:MAG: 50S ribosomal protein L34e [Candidatus Lokiarchaeota archaeon]|nr:50S ribosomal protein L34e [Candidatus Harpocratesius repetitus]
MRGNKRSRSMARIQTRLPGNGHTTHFVRRRPKYAHCPITGAKLHGVPRLRPAQIRKLSKTERTVSRYYGGKISHTALSDAIRKKVLEEYSK